MRVSDVVAGAQFHRGNAMVFQLLKNITQSMLRKQWCEYAYSQIPPPISCFEISLLLKIERVQRIAGTY